MKSSLLKENVLNVWNKVIKKPPNWRLFLFVYNNYYQNVD